jgi:glucose dehydrogenase
MHHNLGPSRREFFAPEFFLVVLLAFGLFSVASVRALFGPLTGRAALLFDDHRVWTLLVYQLSVAPVIMYILWERGWKWLDFSVQINPRGVLQGFGLSIVAFMALRAAEMLASHSAEAAPAVAALPAATGSSPSWECSSPRSSRRCSRKSSSAGTSSRACGDASGSRSR